jgi:uncharacterized membrane protein
MHGHSHQVLTSRADRHRSSTAGRGTRWVLGTVVVLMVAATVAGLVALWPSADQLHRPQYAAAGASFPKGTVAEVQPTACPGDTGGTGGNGSGSTGSGSTGSATTTSGSTDSPAARCGQAMVRVDQGPDTGKVVTVPVPAEVMAAGLPTTVVLLREPQSNGGVAYSLQDSDRTLPLLVLALLFALVVLAVARWRGLLALVGLGLAAVVMVTFMLPALLAGENPVLVALTASSAIMLVVLYLAHGLSVRTTTALLGTMAGLALTALIGVLAVGTTHLTGVSNDETALLRQQVSGLSAQDLLLCGIILAGLGVLNDVTITQSSAVWELRDAAPELSRRELFTKAMRIGRDHIASTIYTIVFAYAGAALSVLMLIVLYAQPLTFTLTSNDIAEEIVRTLASATGLVLAVPITTALATLVVPRARAGRPAARRTPEPVLDTVGAERDLSG